MDDEADSRGPAPPSWPEGIDPEELERQRFQLRKFERVHKQLHTHSNGGTKRKIQGKGTDTGVTRLLRNRSLVASHCPFCTQLRIVNTTGQNNAAAKACACSGAEARGSTTFHFTLDRPVNNEPLKCAGLNGGEAVRKGRCPLNPAPPGALAGAWPPGGPGRGLGTAQAATPNANSNLRRFEWRRSGAQGARQGPGLLASLTIT